MTRCAALAAVVLLSACAPVPQVDSAPAASYQLPAASAAWYRLAATSGSVLLTIDPAQSLIVATVRRGGALARLGHDHVAASHGVSGMVSADRGRADFGFRLDALVVDEAPLRAEAKLGTQPSPDAIAGTRLNMLTRVLEAERHPDVTLMVESAPVTMPLETAQLTPARLHITLHGVTRVVPAQMALAPSPAGLTATGVLTLRQSDFGITPMSIMNGAMTVQDEMELRYRLVAIRR